MGVQVDEPRGDDQPLGVNHPFRHAVGPAADLSDPSVFDPHVASKARDSRTIDNCPTLDVDVVLRHIQPPSLGVVSQLLADTAKFVNPFIVG